MMKSSIGNSSARFGFLLTILCFLILPSATSGSCIDDLSTIYFKESFYPDPSFPRLYIVCPQHIFDIAKLDFNGNVIEPPFGVREHPPLPLRPNIIIRCGDDGSRANQCWLRGGDLHIDGTKVLGVQDDTLDNVVLEGFTFLGAREHALLAHKPGSITFRDCEFRDFTKSAAPIMLDYYDASAPSTELVVTFFGCDFRDNRYFGMGSQSALIYGNSDQNRIQIDGTVFKRNDMLWNNTRPDTHSYIIESLGPVNIHASCFLDNLVGTSDVAVFGSTFNNELNFAKNSSGNLCSFSSVFETTAQFEAFTPTCVEAASVGCERFATRSPTSSPTVAPTISIAPTLAPTTSPSLSPKPTISKRPTPMPTTAAPTVTVVETAEPSEPPIDFFWPTVLDATPVTDSAAALSFSANTMLVLLCSTVGLYSLL